MRVSVVIPFHNRELTLERAIESAINQTLPPYEIILIDDGSTDNSLNIAYGYAARFPNICVLQHPTALGAPLARNRGAAKAVGELLAFLDSDDAWLPEKLAKQVKLISNSDNCPGVFCLSLFKYPSGKIKQSKNPFEATRRDLYVRNVMGSTSCGLIVSNAFKLVGGFTPDMPACQDWDLWLRLSKIGTLLSVQEPLVEIYFDGGGRISNSFNKIHSGHLRIFEMVSDEVNDLNDKNIIVAAQWLRLSEVLGRNTNNISDSFKYAFKSLSLDRSARNFAKVSVSLIATLLLGFK